MYQVKEIFRSIQGEGVLMGVPAVFVRFVGCNLSCTKDSVGYDCDTDHRGGVGYTAERIAEEVQILRGLSGAMVVLTGGEPSLQVDIDLVEAVREVAGFIAIETNGTRPVYHLGVDWVTLSPKTPEEDLLQLHAEEVKVVLAEGMEPPTFARVHTEHWLVSPAWEGDRLPPENVRHCISVVMRSRKWRLTSQLHKLIGMK